MITTIRYILLINIILSCWITAGCQSKKMNEHNYTWTGTLSAPKEYPVEIYNGALKADDFTYAFDPIWGLINVGWGSDAGIMSVDDNKMNLPHELEMTWYSVVENKFYTGKWSLDVQKIKTLWDQGYIDVNNNTKEEFKTFKIGLAPSGNVVLWISGNSRQVEVGAFQAKDTVIQKENVQEDSEYLFRDDYREATYTDVNLYKDGLADQLRTNGWPPVTLYKDFQQRYKWKMIFESEEPAEEVTLNTTYFNGEWFEYKNNSADQIANTQALPQKSIITWKDKISNEKRALSINFDFNELQSFFSKESENEIILEVQLNKANDVVIYLRSGNTKKELKNVKNKLSFGLN